MIELRAVSIDLLRKARILVAKPNHPGSGVPALRREVLAGLDEAIASAAPRLAGPLEPHSTPDPGFTADADPITPRSLPDEGRR